AWACGCTSVAAACFFRSAPHLGHHGGDAPAASAKFLPQSLQWPYAVATASEPSPLDASSEAVRGTEALRKGRGVHVIQAGNLGLKAARRSSSKIKGVIIIAAPAAARKPKNKPTNTQTPKQRNAAPV